MESVGVKGPTIIPAGVKCALWDWIKEIALIFP